MSTTNLQIPIDGITYHTTLHLPSPSHLSPQPPTAPLVALSHALMASPAMWDPLLPPLLSAGYRVLTYAHPGHSPTPSPPASMSDFIHFDTLTSHLLTIIRTHNAACYAAVRANPAAFPDVNLAATSDEDVFALIGCSMGAVLALRFAMLYPTKVQRVIAVGAPGLTSLEKARPLWDERIRVFERDQRDGTEELVEATVQRWLPGTEQRT
ncbi:Hypothetical protein D9617_38g090840 [Elsinoe fawcettii]|nr:Hypothetical protein D9617_38g090840 [Elsinoe fawcettii]